MSTKNNLLSSRTAERHARGQKMLKLSVVEVYDFLTYGKWKWQPQNQIFLIKNHRDHGVLFDFAIPDAVMFIIKPPFCWYYKQPSSVCFTIYFLII